MYILLSGLAALALVVYTVFARRYTLMRREAFIRHVEFPPGLFLKLRAKHPQLSVKECQLVAHGLRQFFLAHLLSGRRFVAMPSEVVDDLWHEFILYTRNYEVFCRQAFGQFLHHSPAVASSPALLTMAALLALVTMVQTAAQRGMAPPPVTAAAAVVAVAAIDSLEEGCPDGKPRREQQTALS